MIKLAHQSRCELGLSYRGVQERLEQYGAHVSVGQIFTYLARWECDSCAAPPAQEPPEQPAEPARTLRSAVSGLLTGQITDG